MNAKSVNINAEQYLLIRYVQSTWYGEGRESV